jgi:hypothetical protein
MAEPPPKMAAEPSPEMVAKRSHRVHPHDGHGAAPRRTTEHTGQAHGLYADCDEEERAEEAPLHRTQPGYGPERDGLGDGVACVS